MSGYIVEAWPQADALFRSDPAWLGSDDAYSVPIGDDRVLWLFGDTFLGPGPRATGRMIRGTVGVQTGLDPADASIAFHEFEPPDGQPDVWRWMQHGALLDGGLLLFCNRVRSSPALFEIFDWSAVLVDGDLADPATWEVRELDRPTAPARAVPGPGVVVDDGHLYAYAPGLRGLDGFVYGRDTDLCLEAFLVRWPVEDAVCGDLAGAEWWCGQDGWRRDGTPVAVWDDGHMEFTVHRDGDRFVQVQGRGLVGSALAIRTAPRPEGPWSALESVHRPPEARRDDICLYAFKAHPHLACDGLAVTYASNGRTFETTVHDPDVYYPRFLRVQEPPHSATK